MCKRSQRFTKGPANLAALRARINRAQAAAAATQGPDEFAKSLGRFDSVRGPFGSADGNNEAERRQRGPVVGRKNFYGSGALWSGRLAAMMFSLFQTLQVWGMDTGKWLTAYLSASAKAGGEPLPDPRRYLPWNMTIEEREHLSVAKPKSPDAKPGNASAPNASAE